MWRSGTVQKGRLHLNDNQLLRKKSEESFPLQKKDISLTEDFENFNMLFISLFIDIFGGNEY